MAPSHRYGQLIAAISIAFLPSCAEAAPRQYEAVQKHWSEKDRDNGKIIEGRDVAPSTHEWQVGILRTDISEVFYALYCGGSHLGSGWVVTAAHCITDLQPKDIDVYAGSLTLDSGGKRYAVQKVIAHPHYNEETMVADIALIRVADLAVGAIGQHEHDEAQIGYFRLRLGRYGYRRKSKKQFPQGSHASLSNQRHMQWAGVLQSRHKARHVLPRTDGWRG